MIGRSLRAGTPLVLALLALSATASGCRDPEADGGEATASNRSTTTATINTTINTTATTATTAASTSESISTSVEDQPQPDQLPLPTDAQSLALALEEAEAAIRDPTIDSELVAPWGRRQQQLYRLLSFHPDWADRALALTDPDLRRAAELNWSARSSLAALVDTENLHAELPAWQVVEPRPAAELLGYYRDGQAQWDIDWTYLAAINLIETRMGRIEGVSTAGAIGPMQFLPTTWAECCDGDPTDPADAIPGAARYLTIRGGPDDMERAIWGYNNSDYYVAAVTAYAAVLRDDEMAYRGYHAWEIYFRTTEGLIRLPVGYDQPEPISAAEWLADNPDQLFTG